MSEVQRPFGVVVASAVDGVRTLFRQHVELARLEVSEAAGVRAQGAGMISAAGVLGLLAVTFAGAALAAGLALVMPTWAAILVVAALFGAGAGILVLAGRRRVREAPAASVRTKEMLKEDARWAKRQIAR